MRERQYGLRHSCCLERCRPSFMARSYSLRPIGRSRPTLRRTPWSRTGCTLLFAMLACQAPLPAADAPLGVVLQASLAHVKDSAITEGATVYPGDELSTEVGGSLDLR